MAITGHRSEGIVEFKDAVLRIGIVGHSFYEGYEHTWDAEVWNAEKQRVEFVTYSSTLGDEGGATVDATDEVRALAAVYRERQNAEAAALRTEREARRLTRGKDVRIVRGRKVPIGTEGRVFWFGPSAYGERVGIEKADGERVFTARTNVEVLLSEEAR